MLGYINLATIEEHACNTEYGNVNGAAGSIHGPEMFLNWHRSVFPPTMIRRLVA